MDPVRNPFSPSAGTLPPALAGRDDEVETMRVAMARLSLGKPARSPLLTGWRGVGKTVLLQEFRRLAKNPELDWVCQPLEASDGMRLPQAMAESLRKALLRLSPTRNMAERVRQALGVVKAFEMRWNLPDGGDVVMRLDPVHGRADSGLLDEDLAGLFQVVGEAARGKGRGVLITLDEVQYLNRESLGAVIAGMHMISQERLPFMLVAAGLPSVAAIAGEARSYAERLFDFRWINSLGAADARAALVEPTREEGVTWQPEALDRIVDETKGYPYFLQQFGKQAWDTAKGPDRITATDVEVAIPLARYDLDTGFFRVRLDRTTDSERHYLLAMASLGKGPYASGKVAGAMGRSTTAVGSLRDKLIRKGLCHSPRHGEIDFTVPMFDDFARRHLAGWQPRRR